MYILSMKFIDSQRLCGMELFTMPETKPRYLTNINTSNDHVSATSNKLIGQYY